MSHKAVVNWTMWGTIIALVAALGVCCTILGRGVDIVRAPERMDRIDGHLTVTDGRVTTLEQFNATNNLSQAYILKDIQREIHLIHTSITN